ncbi:MAG: 5-hydroxyisourate hydrolase [Pseudomonadota bacterium]|jgi:5-hydroxyisourate hydrolase
MGLSTHVLDTMHGCPAAGMAVELWRLGPQGDKKIRAFALNADGRNPDGLLLTNEQMQVGTYRLEFDVAAYFSARGVALPDPPFLARVPLLFGIARTDQHYHVPLLVSPWSYSTYRGS